MILNKFGAALLTVSISFNLFNFQTNEYKDVSANPIIVDVDMSTDVDDTVAIRMATVLDDLDVCSLKAVGICTTDSSDRNLPARAVQGILEYKGYSNVKVGYAHYDENDESSYWDVCSSYADTGYTYEDAVDIYKDVLSSCVNPVTIITTGYLNNIEALLQDKEGYELVKNNCSRIVITGGTYPTGWDNNFGYTNRAKESIAYVNENAPCEIVYVANDVGGPFTAGSIIQKNDSNDPVAKALAAWGTDDGRAAWDPTAVLIGALPSDIFNFDYVYVDSTFDADGTNTFKEVELSNRKVVRRLDSVTLNQYQQLVEGILGAEY
jgi:hypothetical protein